MADEIKVTAKTITVAGRQFTVFKKTFERTLRRFTLMEEAERKLNGNGNPKPEGLEALIRRGFARQTYPSLVACTDGDLWTEEECYKIDEEELDLWLEAGR